VILLDTHALVWTDANSGRLGAKARTVIERAAAAGQLCVSAISYWEVAMLQQKGRLRIAAPLGDWRRDQLQAGLIELPVDGAVGIQAASLSSFHGDPADRLLVATALAHGARLMTADGNILGWGGALDTLRADL
jgi:PIN domain nuclease of toxin-antitoxin system